MNHHNELNKQGIFIWVACALFYTFELMLRTILGTFQAPVSQDLSLTPVSFALLSTTAYFLVYGGMQIPVGIIADKYGLKKSLTIAIFICAISAFAFSYSTEYISALSARILMGFGSSFGFICLLIAVYDWMPKQHYGLFIGLSQFLGTIGPMLAAGPLNSLVEQYHLDWRSVFFRLGLFSIPLATLVILFVKNNVNNTNKFRIISKPTAIRKNLFSLLRQKQTWVIAFYSALVYFIIEYFSENEGKSFLILNGYGSNFSSYMITTGWMGYAIGCPLLGLLSDLFKRRKLIMCFAAICCLSSMISIIYFPINKTVLMLSFFFLGIGASGQSIGFAIMAEQCSKTYLALGIGFNNGMIALLTSTIAPIVGWLLGYHGNAHNLTLSDYHFTFAWVIALISISLILAIFFVKETFCRSTKGYTLIEPHLVNKNNLISN